MDGQDYLNQISADTRPPKVSKFRTFLLSNTFRLILGFIIALLIIIIIGTIISANRVDIKGLSYSLKLHLDNTSEIIDTYQNDIKSSTLRSSSASLASILSNTNNSLTNYLVEKYAFDPKKISEKITEQATLEKDGLDSELFQAKINGNLDRIYAHKMAYEISLISSEESKLYNATNDDNYKPILKDSYDSLLNLYDSFNNFSETK